MNQDFKELIEYLDGKFQKINGEFKETAKKTDLTKLVTLEEFDQFRKETKEGFKRLHQSFDNLSIAVDTYAQKADTYFQEMVMLFHKVDRHEKWFHLIAEKLGIKLEY